MDWTNSFRRLAALLCALVLTLSGSGLGALAEASTPYCGLEEHRHTPDCYREVLVCGQEERAAVTSARKVFQANFPIHTHTDACWGAGGVIRCGLLLELLKRAVGRAPRGARELKLSKSKGLCRG